MLFNIDLMYVEDDESVNGIMTSILRKKLRTVHSFNNGEEAWKFISNNTIDVVITDLKMPGMSGLELAENIRKIDKEMPIIVLSAQGEVDELLQAFDLGITRFLIKPLDPARLFEYLKQSAEFVLKKKELIEQQNLIAALINNYPSPIYVKDSNSRLKLANKAVLDLGSFTNEDVLGKTVQELDLYGSNKATLLKEAETDRPCIEGEKVIANNLQLIDKFNKKHQLRLIKVPLKDEKNRINGLLGITTDISDTRYLQVQLEQKLKEQELSNKALKQAWDEAQKADEAKGRFLSTVSHEIRTPMNSIIGMAEILEDTPLNEEQKEYVSIIRYSSEGLLQIINDVLDQSKMDHGQMKLEYIPINLNRFLAELDSQFGKEARFKGLEFSIDLNPPSQWKTMGDPVRLKQILMNLISNAIKFTDKGSISLNCYVTESRLLLELTDTGIGIAPDKQKSIFDHFQQADSSITRKYGGTGLGLSITRRIVELMKGSINLTSTPGSGSCFICSLPLSSEVDISHEIRNTAALNKSAPELPDTIRLLVVEDNPSNRRVIELYLKSYNWQLDFAENGEEGTRLSRTNDYDVILMDLEMPVMDGYDATIHIRTNSRNSKTPIIALTAHTAKDIREKCFLAGMTEVVNKPLKKSELFEVLSHLFFRKSHSERIQKGNNEPKTAFDPALIMKQIEIDKDDLRQVVDDFIRTWDGTQDDLKAAMKEGDRDAFGKKIHFLKSSMGYFGSREGFGLLRKLNEQEDPSSDVTRELFLRVTSEMKLIKEAYKKFFTT